MITTQTQNATAPDAASAPFAGDQVNPSIAIDADGDYSIVWDGNGAQPHPLYPTQPELDSDRDSQGIFIRSFHAQAGSVNEATGVQSRVNSTASGDQQFPTVAMTPDGDRIVVWSGNGVGDRNGIFFRRYTNSTDTAGPMLTDFLLPDGSRVSSSRQIVQPLSAVILSFDEELLASTATNPANYKLLKDGVEVPGGITQVFYGLNKANQLAGQYGINATRRTSSRPCWWSTPTVRRPASCR